MLCRVFHKSNIGPPSGQRYAPFIEDEWDDSKLTVIPGVETVDEPVAGPRPDACVEEKSSHRKCNEGNAHDVIVADPVHDACVEGNGSHRKCIEGNAHDANVEGNNIDQVCSL